MRSFLTYLFCMVTTIVLSQNDSLRKKGLKKDSLNKLYELNEVEVKVSKDNTFGISRLNNIEGTAINAGKKTEAIYLEDLNANLASNNSRQVFSKVAGINIFENDGSGSQIGIGGRGLNPNRISNFNMRQNGYDISADALGYPESYYTPPTEAIERIEILRGAASLQYGTQFGGMINYKFRQAPLNKKLSGMFRQTVGSFGFINSFNQLSGTVGKLSYNTFYQYKQYEGWRAYSSMHSHNAYGFASYRFSERTQLKVDYTFLNYLSQQPGGLTDKQFETDMYQVNRTRNWFKVNWNLVSVSLDHEFNESTKMNLLVFGLKAGRDALGYLGRIDRKDDTTANRNLLSDTYTNLGSELRVLKRYSLFGLNSHVLVGGRYYQGHTKRLQGDASNSNTADFTFLNPENLENSSYEFPSQNISLFMENIFQLTSKWNITPGMRFEYISTNSKGYYRLLNKDLAGNILLDKKIEDSRSNNRSILLAGIGTQYKFIPELELYLNYSQNYRSINFNDMRVVNPNFQVNPNLKDENGYTLDGGFRGIVRDMLYFDVSGFLLKYNQRIGTVLNVDTLTYQIVRYRTNVSDSRNIGVEAFAEMDWIKLFSKKSKYRFSTFVNTSFINAIYVNSEQPAFEGKKVEYVPDLILRTGLTYTYENFKFSWQYSYTGLQYSDATNSEFSPSAIYGVVPEYTVMDLSVSYTYKKITLNSGVNNLGNSEYFTRRAEGYPGPGIMPGDPRNYYVTLQFKF